MRLIPAIALLAAASMPSAPVDLEQRDRRFEERRGPRSRSRASWYYNPEMTAAELVKLSQRNARRRKRR